MQFTIFELWSHMGVFARLIVGVMLAMSFSSFLVMGERLISLRQSKRESARFAQRMAPMLARGDLDATALAVAPEAGSASGPLGRVIGAGLAAYRECAHRDPDRRFESVARALERQAEREVHSMKKGQSALATIGSTAPFIGLLGTVVGIVNSFQMMAEAGSGGLGTVSAGIAEALVTTALGLLVAIPAVVGFNTMQTFVEARAVDISESANEFLDWVARQLEPSSTRAAADDAPAGPRSGRRASVPPPASSARS